MRRGLTRTQKRYLTRRAVLGREGARCLICGGASDLTLHHLRPRLIGGTNDRRNLAPVCQACHAAINDAAARCAAWLVWLYSLIVLRIARIRARGGG